MTILQLEVYSLRSIHSPSILITSAQWNVTRFTNALGADSMFVMKSAFSKVNWELPFATCVLMQLTLNIASSSDRSIRSFYNFNLQTSLLQLHVSTLLRIEKVLVNN